MIIISYMKLLKYKQIVGVELEDMKLYYCVQRNEY